MSNSHKPLCDGRLERDDAIRVLLEEYRALYGLLQFRMETIDRRMPLVAGGLGGLLLGIPALPTISARVALMILPATVSGPSSPPSATPAPRRTICAESPKLKWQ